MRDAFTRFLYHSDLLLSRSGALSSVGVRVRPRLPTRAATEVTR
jgi:hypothetical protein